MNESARRVLVAVIAVVLLACHENGTLEIARLANASFSVSTSSVRAGERVDVVLWYVRDPAIVVPVASQTFEIASAGEHVLSIQVDLGECLADSKRAAAQDNTCTIVGSMRLRSAAGVTIDSTSIGPLAVVAGASAQASATLRVVGTVSVTTPPAMIVGQSATAQATIRDRENVLLGGRPIAWSSSNAGIAAVNSSGAITAVAPGTSTITATSQGVSGSAPVTVTVGFGVVSISPSADAAGVPVDATVRVTFSENIGATTVTPTSIFLTENGNSVATSRQVVGNVVTLTPSVPLIEFSSAYVVTITPALRSVANNQLSGNFTSAFNTTLWDSNYSYRMTNMARGPSEALETAVGLNSPCFMGSSSNSSGQSWYFEPIVNQPGYYGMHSVLGGSARAVEGADTPNRCYLGGPALFTGQMWRAVSAGALAPGYYYMRNLNFGAAKSLDAPTPTGVPNPQMIPTANTPGQFWLFTRLAHR